MGRRRPFKGVRGASLVHRIISSYHPKQRAARFESGRIFGHDCMACWIHVTQIDLSRGLDGEVLTLVRVGKRRSFVAVAGLDHPPCSLYAVTQPFLKPLEFR